MARLPLGTSPKWRPVNRYRTLFPGWVLEKTPLLIAARESRVGVLVFRGSSNLISGAAAFFAITIESQLTQARHQ